MKNEVRDEELEAMLTELDPPYESKEELKIGRLLDQYGIPFFYKQATIVYDQDRNRIAKPSFTLLSYNGAVIDYINATEEQLLQKEQLYRYNQIPAVVVGPPDLDKPNWDKDLYQKLKRMSDRTFDPMQYTSLLVEK
ncbi:hypothetical protein ACFL5F_08700 [Planctomycetota bacterium]